MEVTILVSLLLTTMISTDCQIFPYNCILYECSVKYFNVLRQKKGGVALAGPWVSTTTQASSIWQSYTGTTKYIKPLRNNLPLNKQFYLLFLHLQQSLNLFIMQ